MSSRAILVALLATILACSCATTVELSEKAVGTFHEKYSKAAWGELYDDVSGGFRRMQSLTEFGDSFAGVRDLLGPAHASRRLSFEAANGSDGVFVKVDYETVFELGTAVETFFWEIRADKARLLSYAVTPTSFKEGAQK